MENFLLQEIKRRPTVQDLRVYLYLLVNNQELRFPLKVQLVTLYQKTGRLDDALQYCFELVESEFWRDSRKWHSCVVELCEIYQVRVVL
jgi:hypothetical protein